MSIQAAIVDPLISNSSWLSDMNYIEKWMVDLNKPSGFFLVSKFEYRQSELTINN